MDNKGRISLRKNVCTSRISHLIQLLGSLEILFTLQHLAKFELDLVGVYGLEGSFVPGLQLPTYQEAFGTWGQLWVTHPSIRTVCTVGLSVTMLSGDSSFSGALVGKESFPHWLEVGGALGLIA